MPKRTSANHPKLWRKSRGGKDYGAYYVTVEGKDVNLGTQNAERARIRMAEAIKGRRGWPTDVEEAARAMEPTTEQLADAAAAPLAAAAPPPAPAASQIAAAPAAPITEPIPDPPAVAPPPPPAPAADPMSEENQRAEADATNAAAADMNGGAGASSGPETSAPIAPDSIIPPGGLDEILKMVASAIVLAQIDLQAWLIKKRTGKIAAPIPTGTKLHELAEAAWVEQFKSWYPDVDSVPPLVLAVALPTLFMLQQARDATDPPKESKQTAATSPPSPATPAKEAAAPATLPPGAVVLVS